jgi:capsule polysaccharide export protein KpsE/RkpR
VAAVEGSVSSTIIPAQSGIDLSPLYAVRGKASTDTEAVQLVDEVVREARDLYIRLNSPDTHQVEATLAGQKQRIEEDLAGAELALRRFERATGSVDMPSQLQYATQSVATLQAKIEDARVDLATAQAIGLVAASRPVQDHLDALKRELAFASTRLHKLQDKQPRWEELTARVESAKSQLAQVEQTERSLVLGQLLPLPGQVKVLDEATVQSRFFWLFLIYTLGALLGITAALTITYLFALYGPPPDSPEGIASAFAAPVLATFRRDRLWSDRQ